MSCGRPPRIGPGRRRGLLHHPLRQPAVRDRHGHNRLRVRPAGQFREVFGDAGAEVFQTTIAHTDRPQAGVVATAVGVVTLLFGASGVFGELKDALNAIWNIRVKPGRGLWGTVRDRFLSFGMVLIIGFLLLVSLVISAALSAFAASLQQLGAAVPVLLQGANILVSFLLVTALFALIFKFLPDARLAWKDVWLGAVVTAALFGVGKELIALYLGKAGVATPFGAAGSIVAFVVWVYYSGLILFFGAEITQVTARHAGRRIEPADNAEVAVDGYAAGQVTGSADRKPAETTPATR